MQQRASFTITEPSPLTKTPESPTFTLRRDLGARGSSNSTSLSCSELELTVRRSMTDWAEIWPSPTAANRALTSCKPKSPTSFERESGDISCCNGKPSFRIPLVSVSLPISMASSRRSCEKWCLILARALGEATKFNQSFEGDASRDLDVKTSTTSPEFSVLSRGMIRPLTLAPIVLCPTSVWTA